MRNLNLLFNKTYYKTIGTDSFNNDCIKNNKKLISTFFLRQKDYRELSINGINSFLMSTSYPGMLVGTGYAHGTSESENDISIGFSFDYVTGQPYIPGSSVKGLLRSYFKNQPQVISALLDNPDINVTKLESEIFDYGDVFLDAVIARGSAHSNRQGGNLLDLDNITPHKEITQNPTPLLLLRIMPEVIIEFRFILKDGILDGILIKADEKLDLFRTIIGLFGAGAKTNVGYGQLTPCSDEELKKELSEIKNNNLETSQDSACASQQTQQQRNQSTRNRDNAINNGDILEGTVCEIEEIFAKVKINGSGRIVRVHISKISNVRINNIRDVLSVGQKVKVKEVYNSKINKMEFSIKDAQ